MTTSRCAVAAGDAGLRKLFDNAVSGVGGSMRSVKVAIRKGPDGKPLSMGFGFVECSSEDVAKAVLRQLQVQNAVRLGHHMHAESEQMTPVWQVLGDSVACKI